MKTCIPKIIHYCWFGGKPLPKLARRCIKSWKKYLPDYEIKQWDESNFDVNTIPYTKQAYEAKKYAFVSDYARFKILYEEGGLYFDTDVQVIRQIDDIIERGPFMGCERKSFGESMPNSFAVAPGLGLGANPGLGLYAELLQLYETLRFKNSDGSLNLRTVVDYTTEILIKHGFKNTGEIQKIADVWIYPWDYFCPMSPTLVLSLTPNSRTIHLYSGSWCSPMVKFRKSVKRAIGYKLTALIQPFAVRIHKVFDK